MPKSDSEKSRRPQDRDFTVDRWEQFPFKHSDDPYENRTEGRERQPAVSQYDYEGWEQNAFPNKEPSEQPAESTDVDLRDDADFRLPSELERQVNATIAAHPEIDAGRIQVKVESGEIVLSGFVPDLQTRQAAAEAASQASGAAPIDNRLIVENNGTAEAQ
jgi:hypothetical protein